MVRMFLAEVTEAGSLHTSIRRIGQIVRQSVKHHRQRAAVENISGKFMSDVRGRRAILETTLSARS